MIDTYDNGGETLDRYTIFIDSDTDCIGASLDGAGFYQHCTGTKGRHLGKRVKITDLSNELLNRLYTEVTE